MRPAIEGIGVCGGFGTGIQALEEALEKGESRSRTVTVHTEEGPYQGPVYLADTERLEDYVPKKALRRIDHYSKLALLGAYLALEDAGHPETDPSRKMGLILASGYGASRTTFTFLDSFIEEGDKFSSPTPFSHSVHNSAAAYVSMFLNMTGPALTVSQFALSVPSAWLTARVWLEEGRVDSVLLGAVDEYCEVLGYCWHRFFGGWDRMQPLALEEQTAVPGEGAAFFFLNSEARAGRTPYGFVEGARMGRGPYDPSQIPRQALLFLGADGHNKCASYYRPVMDLPNPRLCYSPLYGSLPVGPAFDLAAAALTLKNRKIYPLPALPEEQRGSRGFGFESPIPVERICCLKMGEKGAWGEILLGS